MARKWLNSHTELLSQGKTEQPVAAWHGWLLPGLVMACVANDGPSEAGRGGHATGLWWCCGATGGARARRESKK